MDALKDGLLELINAVKAVAPLVWGIMVKQIYSNAIVQLVLGLILLAFLIGLLVLLYKKREYAGTDAWRFSVFLALVVLVITTALFLMSFQGFFNPEYYAIKLLLEQIR